MASECEYPGGAQTPIEVQPYGNASERRLIVGPPGAAVKDLTLAPVSQADAVNNVRRFLITLTDGRQFIGSPFPASAFSISATPVVDTSAFVTKEQLDAAVKTATDGLLREVEQGSSDFATKSDVANAVGAVGLPVGTEITIIRGTAPNGWLRRDGSAFDPEQWPALARVVPSGVLPDDRATTPAGSVPLIYAGQAAY